MPQEESFPIPLEFFDVIRSTHTDLDVAEEKRFDDCWNVDGSRNLSDSWTGFKRFTLLNEILPKGKKVVRGETRTNPNDITSNQIWPDAWTRIGKAAQRREKQGFAMEKPKLEHARNVRGICSIDPGDEEYKDIM